MIEMEVKQASLGDLLKPCDTAAPCDAQKSQYKVLRIARRNTNNYFPTGKINHRIHRFICEVNHKWMSSLFPIEREGQMSRIISVLEMVLMLGFAWGLDYWVNLLRKGALADLNFIPMMWGIAAANLLIAVIWVYLAWLILRRNAGSRWVSLAFLLVGLLFTIFVPLQMTVSHSFRDLLLFEQTRFFRLGIMGMIGFTSRFTLSAAYVCVLGGISLFAPNLSKGYRKLKVRSFITQLF
jgi:hypothetical protein